jgi:hypothetical protein
MVTEGARVAAVAPSAESESEAEVWSVPLASEAMSTVAATLPSGVPEPPTAIGVLWVELQLSTVSAE